MKVNYEEIGTFDAKKAVKGLIELASKIKKKENEKNDK